MTDEKKKPHAGGRGASEGAKAGGPCEANHTAPTMAPLFLARVAVDDARVHLDAVALATDAPPAGMVEAADLLDAVASLLGVSDAVERARAGES